MNIAIALVGHYRTAPICAPNLLCNIVKPLVDRGHIVNIVGHTWNTVSQLNHTWHDDPTKDAELKKKASSKVTVDMFKKLYNTYDITIEKQNIVLPTPGWDKCRLDPCYIKCAYESANKAYNRALDYNPDYILITRPDINYLDKINPDDIRLDSLQVAPMGYFLKDGYASDIWIGGNITLVKKSLELYWNFESYEKRVQVDTHFEKYWHRYINSLNIPITVLPIPFEVPRIDGTCLNVEYYTEYKGDEVNTVVDKPRLTHQECFDDFVKKLNIKNITPEIKAAINNKNTALLRVWKNQGII
jgi:hypothetical protein